MLISRPSWLLESSAIFISASNRSTNMVISLLFSPLYDSYPHEPTILARFVLKIWHGHSSAFACFFLFQSVSYIGKEAPPGSAADHQFFNAYLAQTLSVNSANALFFMFTYGKIHKYPVTPPRIYFAF